jgi:hypothetical protein
MMRQGKSEAVSPAPATLKRPAIHQQISENTFRPLHGFFKTILINHNDN